MKFQSLFSSPKKNVETTPKRTSSLQSAMKALSPKKAIKGVKSPQGAQVSPPPVQDEPLVKFVAAASLFAIAAPSGPSPTDSSATRVDVKTPESSGTQTTPVSVDSVVKPTITLALPPQPQPNVISILSPVAALPSVMSPQSVISLPSTNQTIPSSIQAASVAPESMVTPIPPKIELPVEKPNGQPVEPTPQTVELPKAIIQPVVQPIQAIELPSVQPQVPPNQAVIELPPTKPMTPAPLVVQGSILAGLEQPKIEGKNLQPQQSELLGLELPMLHAQRVPVVPITLDTTLMATCIPLPPSPLPPSPHSNTSPLNQAGQILEYLMEDVVSLPGTPERQKHSQRDLQISDPVLLNLDIEAVDLAKVILQAPKRIGDIVALQSNKIQSYRQRLYKTSQKCKELQKLIASCDGGMEETRIAIESLKAQHQSQIDSMEASWKQRLERLEKDVGGKWSKELEKREKAVAKAQLAKESEFRVQMEEMRMELQHDFEQTLAKETKDLHEELIVTKSLVDTLKSQLVQAQRNDVPMDLQSQQLKLDELQRQVDVLQAEKVKFIEEIKTLRRQWEDQIHSLNKVYADAQGEMEREFQHEQTHELDKLREELMNLEAEKEGLEYEWEKQEEVIEHLQRDLAKSTMDLEEFKKSNGELQDEISKLRVELAEIEQRQHDKWELQIKTLTHQVEQAKSALTKMEDDVLILGAEKEEKEKQIKVLETRVAELTDLTHQENQQDGVISKEEAFLLQQKIVDLTGQLNAKEEFVAKAERVEFDAKHEVAAAQEELCKVIEELKVVKEELDEANGTLTKTRQQVANLESQLTTAQQQVLRLEKDLIASAGQISNVKSELTNTQQQLQNVQGELSLAREEVIKTRDELSVNQKELAQAKSQLYQDGDLKGNVQGLELELSELKSQLSNKDQELNKKGEEVEEISMELNQTTTELTQAKGELFMVKTELAETKVELQSTKNDLTKSKDELTSVKRELINSKGDLSNNVKELSKVTNDLNKTSIELSSCKRELNKNQGELSTTKAELIGNKKDYSKLQSEFTQLSKQFNHMKDELSSTKGDLSMTRDELRSTKSSLSQLKQEMSDLQSEMTQVEMNDSTQVEILEKELQSMMERMELLEEEKNGVVLSKQVVEQEVARLVSQLTKAMQGWEMERSRGDEGWKEVERLRKLFGVSSPAKASPNKTPVKMSVKSTGSPAKSVKKPFKV